jgi:hypothetical protein
MRYSYLTSLIFSAALSASVSAQSVKTGIDAWQRSDYATAVAVWRPLAEKGDADAQFNLGQAYRLGRGVSINLAAAQTWFERAAEKGHLDAQTTLGLMLFQNGNRTGGLRWIKLAAEKSEPRAMLVYGTALFNGDGVGQDTTLGYAYVARAAAQGLMAARDTLTQLDGMLSPDERKKGQALAAARAKAAPPPPGAKSPAKASVKAVKPAAPPAARVVQAAPKPPAPATGNWRIQLGAFSQRSSAEALFRKVSGKLSGRQAYYLPAGAVTRLQVGPFESKAAASAACQAVGQACFPVAAK